MNDSARDASRTPRSFPASAVDDHPAISRDVKRWTEDDSVAASLNVIESTIAVVAQLLEQATWYIEARNSSPDAVGSQRHVDRDSVSPGAPVPQVLVKLAVECH